MSRFRRTRSGVEARLTAAEATLLRQLLAELIELLGEPEQAPPRSEDPLEALLGGATEPQATPTDPVLARLFPDAYADDAGASAEYRGLMGDELRTGKVAAARRVLASLPAGGGATRLDEPTAQAWLVAVNDLRLSLGTRLEVTEEVVDGMENLPPDDPRLPALTAYVWLGWLQETLLDEVAR